MKRFFLVITLLLAYASNNANAQFAAVNTSPFEAVKLEDGNKVLVLVEGKWYETLAIDGTPSSMAIEYCRYNYKEDWLAHFSEELVQVMKKLKKPLHSNIELQLLDGNARTPIKVTVTKDKYESSKRYNRDHGITLNTGNKNDATADMHLSKEKPYAFRSVKIEYLYTGSKEAEGREILFIGDEGNTVVVISDKKDAKGLKEVKATIWKDNKTTYIDHKNKTWKTSSSRDENTKPQAIGYSTDAQRKLDGYVNTGKHVLAGKDCMVYEHPGKNISYWLWKGAILKTAYTPLGTNGYQKIATAVYENADIPPSVMDIPAGYKKE